MRCECQLCYSDQEIIDIQLFPKYLFLWNLERPFHQRCLLSDPVLSHFSPFYSLSVFFTEIIIESKVISLLYTEMELSVVGCLIVLLFPGSVLHENTSITCLKRKWMQTIHITEIRRYRNEKKRSLNKSKCSRLMYICGKQRNNSRLWTRE
jgi:hypothetical protein